MELCQDIFDESNHIRDDVKDVLLQIADDFIDFLDLEEDLIIKDVLLTGSIANYNYTDVSDIDLHLLIDTFMYNQEYTILLKKYLDVKKVVWNTIHNIKIGSHEVEIYPQDTKESLYATGVYSLKEGDWIVEPTSITDNNYRNIVNSSEVNHKVKKYMDYIDYLESLYISLDINVSGEEFLKKIEELKEKLKNMRKQGLASEGEYSIENITFKELRRNGYIKKLLDLKHQAYDSLKSIDKK